MVRLTRLLHLNEFPIYLKTFDCVAYIQFLNSVQILLVQIRDTTEDVNMFIVERAARMVVSTLIEESHLSPVVTLDVVKLGALTSFLIIFSRTSDYNKVRTKSTCGMTVTRILHLCFLFKFIAIVALFPY